MSRKLPVNGFKWVKNVSKIDEDFTKNCDENSDEGYILEVNIKYPRELHDLHSDLSFLPERSATSFYAISMTKNYVVHIRSLKQALNHGLILKNEFNQEAWLKPYINKKKKLIAEAENDSEREFFKLMNNSVFGKTMENVRKYIY